MTNPTEEDWIKLPKEVADAVRGWCLQNGFDGDGRVSYVYAGCALVAITSLLDSQQSKLEEIEKEVERRGAWIDAAVRTIERLESQIDAAKVEGFNEGIEAAISVADKHGHARLNPSIKMGKRDKENMERMAAQCLLISVDLQQMLSTVADSKRGGE